MLDRPEEYKNMAKAEDCHWWYKSLHTLVIKTIKEFSFSKDCKILDAGCGTGGLLQGLREEGYTNIKGFDISELAVKECKKRNLKVIKEDLKLIGNAFPNQFFDVIISNDTLFFLEEREIKCFIDSCTKLLNPKGLILLNFPTLDLFRGVHDRAVGIRKRFSGEEIKSFVNVQLTIEKELFWPFLLSPLILVVRFWQRLKIYFFPKVKIKSDLEINLNSLNGLLFKLCCWEHSNLKLCLFASSKFLTLRKKG